MTGEAWEAREARHPLLLCRVEMEDSSDAQAQL